MDAISFEVTVVNIKGYPRKLRNLFPEAFFRVLSPLDIFAFNSIFNVLSIFICTISLLRHLQVSLIYQLEQQVLHVQSILFYFQCCFYSGYTSRDEWCRKVDKPERAPSDSRKSSSPVWHPYSVTSLLPSHFFSRSLSLLGEPSATIKTSKSKTFSVAYKANFFWLHKQYLCNSNRSFQHFCDAYTSYLRNFALRGLSTLLPYVIR